MRQTERDRDRERQRETEKDIFSALTDRHNEKTGGLFYNCPLAMQGVTDMTHLAERLVHAGFDLAG